MPSIAEIHDYYAGMTEAYTTYSAGTGGWHVGLWDAGVTTHGQSLLATNRRLLAGLAIDANTHILDAGCGSGSLAISGGPPIRLPRHGHHDRAAARRDGAVVRRDGGCRPPL